MSYIITQMVRGKPYAYEAEAYWDPIKKQSRQRRKYIGADGSIVPKTSQREVTLSKTFGPSYLLTELAEQAGLLERLKGAFGPEAEEILALAITRIVRPAALRNVQPLLDESFLPEILGLERELTSQRLPAFLASLSRRDGEMRAFFRSLVSEDDALIFDITSLSSSSRSIDLLEYGADYRATGLPQINLGLVVSLSDHCPLYYKLFPGSVTDVVTLRNLVAEVRDLGVRECMFVLDRGFYSESNVNELLDAGMDFLMPLPFGRGVAKRLVTESNRTLSDPRLGHILDGELYRVHESRVDIAGRDLTAFVIVSEKRMADEKRTLFSRLQDIEASLNSRKWHPGMKAVLNDVAKRHAPFLTVRNVDGVVRLERRRNAIAQAENRCGKMLLMTSKDMSWNEALTRYRLRDEAERDFDQLKNELGAEPLRVSSPASLRGHLFVLFVSLVLRSLLLERASGAKLLGKYWIDDMLLELAKLKATRIGEDWRLSEMTRKQRELLLKLGVPLPQDPLPR